MIGALFAPAGANSARLFSPSVSFADSSAPLSVAFGDISPRGESLPSSRGGLIKLPPSDEGGGFCRRQKTEGEMFCAVTLLCHSPPGSAGNAGVFARHGRFLTEGRTPRYRRLPPSRSARQLPQRGSRQSLRRGARRDGGIVASSQPLDTTQYMVISSSPSLKTEWE